MATGKLHRVREAHAKRFVENPVVAPVPVRRPFDGIVSCKGPMTARSVTVGSCGNISGLRMLLAMWRTMNTATRRTFQMGLLALLFALHACSSSKSASGGKDAAPDGKDGPTIPGADVARVTGTDSTPANTDSAQPTNRDGASAEAGAGLDASGLDAAASGDVPSWDAIAADGLSVDVPISGDAPVALDATIDVPGIDVGSATLTDTSVNQGPELDGGAVNSAETGGTDVGAVDVLDDNFSCNTPIPPDAGISQRLCYDFSSVASANDFVPEAGNWSVAGGIYTAIGPAEEVTCPPDGGTVMTASVLAGLSAQNVRVHAKMTSVVGADKLLVLRSRPGGNRIEVNFRANFVYQGQPSGGDLNVADLVDCVDVGDYIDAGGANRILVPHAVGQAIVVDLQLIGQQLTIAVDGQIVFDGSLPLSTKPGSVGFAVFRSTAVLFDDFVVDVLD